MAAPIFYHASFDVITGFWPLTHFGTRQAAIEAVENKNPGPGTRPGYLYRAQLDLGGNPVRLVDDHGTPRPVGFLMAMFAMPNSPHFNYATFTRHRAELERIYGDGPHRPFRADHPNDLAARQYVAGVISGLGYTSVEYVNLVEHVGSTAVVILGGTQASNINSESLTVQPRQGA